MPAAVPVVEAKGVFKSFRIPAIRRDTVREHLFHFFRPRSFNTLVVLDSIDLEVRSGEALGIMGRNGSGKSTLLKVLSGIYPPEQGSVIARAPCTPLLELGVGWNFELDAIDNILLIGTCMGLSLKQAKAAVDEILVFSELQSFAKLPLKHYSSGMAARLAYATAFTAVREVLIIDEIFAVGDAGFIARCKERLGELRRKGHTLITVSHDPALVESYCSRGILLEGGRIVRDGSASEIARCYLELVAHHLRSETGAAGDTMTPR